jgi:uncharacterized membrane protein YvbJ
MKCFNCGNEVTTEGTNCPFCGSPLSADAGNQMAYNQQTNNIYNTSNASIDPKTAGIICYITWIGFLIALLAGDKNHPFLKHHLNNALIILIGSFALGVVAIIPILGWIAASVGEIFLFV